MIVSNDRTRDELREHTYVCAVVYEIFLSLSLAFIDIGNVRNILECVKADTDREDDILNGKARMQQRIDVFAAESPVLEKYQPPEVKDCTKKQPCLFSMAAFFNELPDYEVEQSSQQEKIDVDGFLYAETVKNNAAREDDEIFVLFA